MAKDYYQTLGVSKSAGEAEIKKAFRKLAHEHHPDKKGGNAEKFKELNEAYQILGNAAKRKKYDQFGEAAFSGQGFGGTGMNWEDFMRAAQGGQAGGFSGFSGRGNFGGVEFDLGDILGDVFGFGSRARGRRRSRAAAGEDMAIEISLDFLEAIFGAEKTIRLERELKCPRCFGNGAEPNTKIKACARCGGQGEIVQTRSTIFGAMQTSSVCPECEGEGKKAEKPCGECRGAGRTHRAEEIRIKIPAGINSGQSIKMSGLGNAGDRGGGSGDLFVQVRVKPHKKFKRDGDDILTEENISISQAVLGDDIIVETVHGAVRMKIPSGTPSGKIFRLAAKGAPRLQGSGRGDHLATINIIIPSRLSREEKELFEKLKHLGK